MTRELWIVDWKSSKDIYEEMRIQCATYAWTHKHIEPSMPLPKVGVLRLDKETGIPDFQDVSEGMDDRFRSFLGLRDYYKHSNHKEPKKGYDFQGKKIPSVTTILGCLEKPALLYWSANSAIDYIIENLEEIRNPDTSPERIEQVFKKARSAFRTASKKAMDIGSMVHDAIECYLAGGKPEPILDGNDKATNSFLAFLEWKDKVKMEPIALEKVLINSLYEFGGTCDFVGYLDIQ